MNLIKQIKESPKGTANLSNLWKLNKRRPIWARIVGKMLNRIGMGITGIALFADLPVMGLISLGAMALSDGLLEMWELSDEQG